MAFLNPLLLFGILGVAAPIIIHLLARKRIKRVVWAAMRFVKEVVERNQQRLTLEDLILLALRCLLLIVLALALARPAFKQGGVAGLGGSETAILLLDNSASMAQSDGVASKFEQAQKAAEDVLDSLPGGSSVAVWLVSDVVKDIIPEPTHDFALARKTIRGAQRLDRGTLMQPALRRAIEALQRQPGRTREIFLFTDGQAEGWKQLAETRAQLEAVKKEVPVRLVVIGESERRNIGVTGLRMAAALAPVNEPIRFEVEVTNAGLEEAKNVQVGLAVDAEPPADAASIESISAGEVTKISLFVTFREAGYHSVTARLPADRNPADDQRTLAVRVLDDINVLLVDGDPGIEPRESEVFYLRNALTPVSPEQREHYYIKTKVITPGELEGVKFSDYEAMVLANVADLPDTVLAALEKYLRGGGGLLVFPGGKINAAFYNTKLFAERGILPAAFGEGRGNAEQQEQFLQLQAKGCDHPIVSLWRDPAAGSLATAQFFRALPLQAAKGTPPRAEAGPPAVVLSYANGQPAMMERAWGHGRVVQFSSTADAAWNNLCVRPIFVPLIHRTLGALLTRQDERLNLQAGTKLNAVVDAELLGKDVLVHPPAGRPGAASLRRVAAVSGVPMLSFDETEGAGTYDVRLGDDATPLLRFAAQADAAESRLEELSPTDWKAFEGVARVIRWRPELDLRAQLQQERMGAEFWFALIVLAAGVAIAETTLANRWSRSR